MALVGLSGNTGFIFTHIYKCGGMTVRHLLRNNSCCAFEVLKAHSTAQQIKDSFHSRGYDMCYNKLFKFSFVRNPFSWVVSLHNFIKKYPQHENYKEVKKLSFEQFCEWNANMIASHKQNINGDFNTLSGFLCDKNDVVLPDFIGRQETFEDDFRKVLTTLQIAVPEIPKYNAGNADIDYRGYYNANSRAIIESAFAKDLTIFNYQF